MDRECPPHQWTRSKQIGPELVLGRCRWCRATALFAPGRKPGTWRFAQGIRKGAAARGKEV